jgi:hypothetical protein
MNRWVLLGKFEVCFKLKQPLEERQEFSGQGGRENEKERTKRKFKEDLKYES